MNRTPTHGIPHRTASEHVQDLRSELFNEKQRFNNFLKDIAAAVRERDTDLYPTSVPITDLIELVQEHRP